MWQAVTYDEDELLIKRCAAIKILADDLRLLDGVLFFVQSSSLLVVQDSLEKEGRFVENRTEGFKSLPRH